MGEREKKAAEAGRQSWTQLFYSAGARLVPLVVSASALLGFVAFAGAVIVWTRFFAVKVPPDQVVTAVPRGELVATGSSLLLLFGFFGVLTAIATYLIDRGGRATPGMARGLLVILGLEGITAIVIDAGGLTEEALGPVAVFAGLLLGVLSLTLFDTFTSISDSLLKRNGERIEPRPRLAVPWILDRLDQVKSWLEMDSTDDGSETQSRQGALKKKRRQAVKKKIRDARKELDAVRVRVEGLESSDGEPTEAEEKAEDAVRHAEEELESLTAEEARGAVGWLKVRPNQLKFTGWGVASSLVLIGIAILLSARLREEPWVAVSLGAATLLAIGLWRIAALSKETFLWFGLAAFISVPLFGTLTLMAQNLDDPQVQPVALIRSADGPDEAIQGLYVTEGDDRVYFATVATEGCDSDIRDGSGRLLWVPKSEVVAMSVGPLQSVEDAARASLEMADALTPAIETPRGPITLHGGLLDEADSPAEDAPPRAPRLENSGPAVRPTFGTGVTLDPETAPPGEEVKLTMNTAGGDAEEPGFGPVRKGKTLRVGGVEAAILKERTSRAWQAEFVKTRDGTVLPLDKEGLYRKVDGEYEAVEPRYVKKRAYVKLSRRSGVKRSLRRSAANGGSSREPLYIDRDPDGGVFLIVQRPGSRPKTLAGRRKAAWRWKLAPGQKVKLREDESAVPLKSDLLRQAWGEKQIKFRVPENAPSGVLTIECKQLAGQPLLQVERPPQVQLSMHMADGNRIVLDGSRTRDDGRIKARRWMFDGRLRGRDKERLSLTLPSRLGVHRLQLAAEDESGEIGTATVYVARLPRPQIAASKSVTRSVRRIRNSLARAAAADPPQFAEVHGHAPAESDSTVASLALAEAAVEKVLNVKSAQDAGLEGEVPVRIRAYGDACEETAERGRHVDVFLLSAGVRLLGSQGCRPRHLEGGSWHPGATSALDQP